MWESALQVVDHIGVQCNLSLILGSYLYVCFMWFGGLNVGANDFEICFTLDSYIKLFCVSSSSLEEQTKS